LQVLELFSPANKILQAENTDFSTGVMLITSCVESVGNLRTEQEFRTMWDEANSQNDAHLRSRRNRRVNTLLADYVIEEATGNIDVNEEEMRRLFYSLLDHVVSKMDVRFNERNSRLFTAVAALQPEHSNFLNAKLVQPILDLAKCTIVESEFIVAKAYIAKLTDDDKPKITITKLLSEHSEVLKAMPTVYLALQLAVTLGASTAMCENSFSVLKNVMRDDRKSMLHPRKAHLVQMAFEDDLTKKLKNEWKELVFRKFSTSSRRLQLFLLTDTGTDCFLLSMKTFLFVINGVGPQVLHKCCAFIALIVWKMKKCQTLKFVFICDL